MASKGLYVTNQAESSAVADFWTCASKQPCGLLVEGEAGIGKTTFWLGVQRQAREQGFDVLSARPAQAEAVLAYAVLADLLSDVDPAVWANLPQPQRLAIDRVLLRVNDDDASADPRAVAAAFLGIIEELARRQKLVLAIDDLQWVDPSSASVIAFAARRISGPVGIVAAVRTNQSQNPGTWLQLPRPDALRRIELSPMSLDVLHQVISQRLGRSFPRPTMVRIHEVSGGSPLYAIELARTIRDANTKADIELPPTLAELVHARLTGLGSDTRDLLLAAACLGEPTLELTSAAVEFDPDGLRRALEEAETAGILVLDGHRIRFSHPLLASGVYTGASPLRRRDMHRRLAEVVTDPEVRARHLALSTVRPDAALLESLDAAAEMANSRGAPVAGAELLDLAIRFGGGTPERRIRAASYYFDSGDPDRADTLLADTIRRLPRGILRATATNLRAVVCLLNNSFLDAVGLLEGSLDEASGDLGLLVQMLVTLAFALLNAGRIGAAITRAEQAVTEGERLSEPQPLSQALGMRAMLHFMRGDGLDEHSMRRALELENPRANVSTAFQPSVQYALLLAWTGELDRAAEDLQALRRRCLEQGAEAELIFVDFHSVVIEVWRGNFAEAASLAEGTLQLAQQMNGALPLFVGWTVTGTVAAYAGRDGEARRALAEAVAAGQRSSSSHQLGAWPIVISGFLEVSLGNYQAALKVLEPLLSALHKAPLATEIIGASFIPDAVEAFVQLGRLAEADPLIAALEANGRRLDRPWMLAVAGRCRAMLLAAQGELQSASLAVEAAMAEHDRLPMPFERARTQLLFGQLQHRRRLKSLASSTLRSAVQTFEELGTPLWAQRARAELARVKVGPQSAGALSAAEQRAAELAASGMTNREIAATMLISPKTVERNLSRVYRKLGIRSRADLGRFIDQQSQ
jgi:ATP/maltotriose-dependent transcriptional regulator MalT